MYLGGGGGGGGGIGWSERSVISSCLFLSCFYLFTLCAKHCTISPGFHLSPSSLSSPTSLYLLPLPHYPGFALSHLQ